MANEDKIEFELCLSSYDNQPVADVRTRLEFRHDGEDADRFIRRFPAGKEQISLPKFPLGRWDCWVSAKRFEITNTGWLPSQSGETVDCWLPRRVRAGWNVQFDRWNKLRGPFTPLKRLLDRSPNLTMRIRGNKDERLLGRFSKDTYDDVDDRDLIEAKVGMLNTFAKMVATPLPGSPGNWFSMMREALYIRRDRIVAIAKPEMAQMVRRVLANKSMFSLYDEAYAELHRKNIPAQYRVRKIYSIKSKENIGVLQVTIAEVVDENDQPLVIADTDIDENGMLLAHFGDFIKHQFSGGTHPFHVYDILHRIIANPALGYRLV